MNEIINETIPELRPPVYRTAVLDEAHIGDINGAFGTIRHGDHGPRTGWRARAMTLLAILGPGLIVMTTRPVPSTSLLSMPTSRRSSAGSAWSRQSRPSAGRPRFNSMPKARKRLARSSIRRPTRGPATGLEVKVPILERFQPGRISGRWHRLGRESALCCA